MQIMTINEFATRCGYFFNAGTDPEALCVPNNGYNCKHPEQTEKQNGVGVCQKDYVYAFIGTREDI